MADWFLVYTRPFAPPSDMALVLVPEGESKLIITGPTIGVRWSDRGEIGTYLHVLDAEKVEAARALLLQALKEVPANGAPITAGTRLMQFGWGEGDEGKDLARVPLINLAPRIAELDQRMQEIAESMLDHPALTAQAQAAWQKQRLAREEQLGFTIRLRNSGSQPISIPNPAASEEAGVGLRILLQKDLPEEDLDDEDTQLIEVRRPDVRQLAAPGKETGEKPDPVVPLQPGEELALAVTVSATLYVEPGKYRAIVIYRNWARNVPEAVRVLGVLPSHTGSMEYAFE